MVREQFVQSLDDMFHDSKSDILQIFWEIRSKLLESTLSQQSLMPQLLTLQQTFPDSLDFNIQQDWGDFLRWLVHKIHSVINMGSGDVNVSYIDTDSNNLPTETLINFALRRQDKYFKIKDNSIITSFKNIYTLALKKCQYCGEHNCDCDKAKLTLNADNMLKLDISCLSSNIPVCVLDSTGQLLHKFYFSPESYTTIASNDWTLICKHVFGQLMHPKIPNNFIINGNVVTFETSNNETHCYKIFATESIFLNRNINIASMCRIIDARTINNFPTLQNFMATVTSNILCVQKCLNPDLLYIPVSVCAYKPTAEVKLQYPIAIPFFMPIKPRENYYIIVGKLTQLLTQLSLSIQNCIIYIRNVNSNNFESISKWTKFCDKGSFVSFNTEIYNMFIAENEIVIAQTGNSTPCKVCCNTLSIFYL